jgi:TPP-dependent pyruvate/acetoin dehydrogenase alpha subunit
MPQATEAATKRRGKAKAPSLSRDEMLRAYRDMLLIRRF